jgi:hypothetical protein
MIWGGRRNIYKRISKPRMRRGGLPGKKCIKPRLILLPPTLTIYTTPPLIPKTQLQKKHGVRLIKPVPKRDCTRTCFADLQGLPLKLPSGCTRISRASRTRIREVMTWGRRWRKPKQRTEGGMRRGDLRGKAKYKASSSSSLLYSLHLTSPYFSTFPKSPTVRIHAVRPSSQMPKTILSLHMCFEYLNKIPIENGSLKATCAALKVHPSLSMPEATQKLKTDSTDLYERRRWRVVYKKPPLLPLLPPLYTSPHLTCSIFPKIPSIWLMVCDRAVKCKKRS